MHLVAILAEGEIAALERHVHEVSKDTTSDHLRHTVHNHITWALGNFNQYH